MLEESHYWLEKKEKNWLRLIYFWENDARDKVGVKLLKEEDRQVITSWNGTLKLWGSETLKFRA